MLEDKLFLYFLYISKIYRISKHVQIISYILYFQIDIFTSIQFNTIMIIIIIAPMRYEFLVTPPDYDVSERVTENSLNPVCYSIFKALEKAYSNVYFESLTKVLSFASPVFIFLENLNLIKLSVTDCEIRVKSF